MKLFGLQLLAFDGSIASVSFARLVLALLVSLHNVPVVI